MNEPEKITDNRTALLAIFNNCISSDGCPDPRKIGKVLDALDESRIGTEKYTGRVAFGPREFAPFLQPASDRERVAAHKDLLAAGLDPTDDSFQNLMVIVGAISHCRSQAIEAREIRPPE